MAAPAAQDVPVPTDGADPWDDRDPWQPALDSQQGSEDEEAFSRGAGDGDDEGEPHRSPSRPQLRTLYLEMHSRPGSHSRQGS